MSNEEVRSSNPQVVAKSAEPRSAETLCYFCKSPCTEDEFCHGCGEAICSQCDETFVTGTHEPEDHKS